MAEGFFLTARSAAWAAYTPGQRELIEQATAKSLAQVGQYTQALMDESLAALDRAGKAIHASILSLGDLSQFTAQQLPGKQVELARLKAVEQQIAQVGTQLKKDLKLAYQGVTKDMATAGIGGVLDKLGALKLPGYKDLAPVLKEDIAAGAFSLVNTQAFDFLTGYQLQLLGKLSDDLVTGVKQAISAGIVQGQGPAKIARSIGGVVKDPDEFRKAGKTVFKSVQQRAELIARSETLRAYNQGAVKFEQQIGVTKVVWLTAGDERTCPDCGPLDGKEYALLGLPSQPLHPACRCTHVPASGVLAGITDLPVLEQQISVNTLAQQTVKDATKSGDYTKLTVQQLREVAKEKGVSIARTKAERMAILAQTAEYELGFLKELSPAELDELFKHYKVGALKTREDLIKALNHADAGKDVAKIAVKEKALKEATDAAKKAQQAAELELAKAKAMDEAKTAGNAHLAALKDAAKPESFVEYHAARQKLMDHISATSKVLGPDNLKDLIYQANTAISQFNDAVTLMPQTKLREILKAAKVKNFQWYTKGETVEYMLSPASQQKLAEQVAAKVAAAKPGKAVKVAKPAAPAPTPKPAKAPAPAPVPAPQKSAIVLGNEADQAWEAFKASNKWTFDGSARSLGGAHTKYFFRDADGNRWLFKPITEEFRAWGDEVAYKIAREIDPGAVEVRFIELPVEGKMAKGSIQRMKTGLANPKDYEGVDLAGLGGPELAQLQREHVIDWLISNHDGHTAQFLRGTDGSVTGIDKGQLFKFFGQDKLSTDYYPNRIHNAGEPVYNQLMRLHRDGKISLDLQATGEFIRRAELITDSAYKAMLRPYAERRFAGKPGALADFLEQATARKNSLRADFEKFYSEIESVRTGKKVEFRFGDTRSKKVSPVTAPAPEEIYKRDGGLDLKFEASEIQASGWQGKSLPIDKDQIEDQNILVQQRFRADGGKQTVMRLRLRPEADAKLVDFLKSQSVAVSRKSKIDWSDPYWDTILAGVKHWNFHLKNGDLSLTSAKLEAVLDLKPKLKALLSGGTVAEKKMAQAYLDIVDTVERAMGSGTPGEIPMLQQFSPSPADLAVKTTRTRKATDSRLKVIKRTGWTEDMTATRGDNVVLQRTTVPLREFNSELTGSSALEFEVDLGDGVKVVHKPFQSTNAGYSMQGRMSVVIDEAVSDSAIAKGLEKLRMLGLNTDVADPASEELMYLQKVAYSAKLHQTKAFRAAADQAAQMSPEEAVKVWRETWSRHLGVPDVTKLKEYNPKGVYQKGASGKSASGGARLQYRFDISDEGFKKEMGDYVLIHRITNDGGLDGFFDIVLQTNRSFIPTVERLYTGVPVGGMSPGQDFHSGGASYFFTRIRKRAEAEVDMIHLRSDLLRRADAISYSGDEFGRVTGDHVTTWRGTEPDDWRKFSKHKHNETIFKGSVNILDNIELLPVSSDSRRKSLLAVFKKHGVTRLPDGRRIEDVIVVKK